MGVVQSEGQFHDFGQVTVKLWEGSEEEIHCGLLQVETQDLCDRRSETDLVSLRLGVFADDVELLDFLLLFALEDAFTAAGQDDEDYPHPSLYLYHE